MFQAPKCSRSSRETLMRRCVKMGRNTVREESKPSAFCSGLSDFFLLAATECDFLSCPGLSPYRVFLTDGPSKQLCSLQLLLHVMLPREAANSWCIPILHNMFPKWICHRIPLILNNIHSQLIHNEIIGCYNAN